MPEEKKVIEINGVKLEVDMRYAKVLDQYKVGDSVKLLTKEYNSNYVSYPGIIIGFNNFKELPTIIIAYLKVSYSEATMCFAYLNKESKDIEICPMVDEVIPFDTAHVIDLFDRKILAKEQEVENLKAQKDYFMNQFGAYFKNFK